MQCFGGQRSSAKTGRSRGGFSNHPPPIGNKFLGLGFTRLSSLLSSRGPCFSLFKKEGERVEREVQSFWERRTPNPHSSAASSFNMSPSALQLLFLHCRDAEREFLHAARIQPSIVLCGVCTSHVTYLLVKSCGGRFLFCALRRCCRVNASRQTQVSGSVLDRLTSKDDGETTLSLSTKRPSVVGLKT